MPAARELGSLPLVVIGAGPTGVAALFCAALEGIPAIGLEAGDVPLADVHAYPHQMTLLSPGSHYEVADIPLDCRTDLEVTREEVLSYYARLIRLGGVDIRLRQRCIGLEPRDGEVRVIVETPDGSGYWRAKDVVVTCWFRRRLPPVSWNHSGLPVLSGIIEPSRLSGRRAVIIGGGLSAYEQAVALMYTGQPVTVVARNHVHRLFRTQAVADLIEATNSRVVDQAASISVRHDGVVFAAPDGTIDVISCDVVIACLGREPCPAMTAVLVAAGVVSEQEVEAQQAATATYLARRAETGALDRFAEELPDFWTQLIDGVHGVRLAGAALHTGGAGAGVQLSILAAYLAVQTILRRPPPPFFDRPLPVAVRRMTTTDGLWADMRRWFDSLRGYRFDVVAELCPLAIRSWSRIAIRPAVDDEESGNSAAERRSVADARAATDYLLSAPDLDRQIVAELLRVSDGTQTLRSIASGSGLEYDGVLSWMSVLWRHNAVTWLPSRDGLQGVRLESRASWDSYNRPNRS